MRRRQEQTNLSRTDLVNRAITSYEFFDAQLRAGRPLLVSSKKTGEVLPVELPTAAAELRISREPVSGVDAKSLPAARSGSGHVFISYVSEDSVIAERLQRDLERAGITVWRDRRSLGPGDLWKPGRGRAADAEPRSRLVLARRATGRRGT